MKDHQREDEERGKHHGSNHGGIVSLCYLNQGCKQGVSPLASQENTSLFSTTPVEGVAFLSLH